MIFTDVRSTHLQKYFQRTKKIRRHHPYLPALAPALASPSGPSPSDRWLSSSVRRCCRLARLFRPDLGGDGATLSAVAAAVGSSPATVASTAGRRIWEEGREDWSAAATTLLVAKLLLALLVAAVTRPGEGGAEPPPHLLVVTDASTLHH